MGPRSHQMERLILIAMVAIAVELVLPAYPKVVAKLAARGIELSWFGHIELFALVILVGLLPLALVGVVLGVVGWLIDRASRRPDNRARKINGDRGSS